MSYNAILSDEEVNNDPPVFLSTKTPKKIRKIYLEFKAEVDRWYEEICPASYSIFNDQFKTYFGPIRFSI